MKREDIFLLIGILFLTIHDTVFGATGMMWERSLDTVASSLTGKAGVAAATIAVAWSGINYRMGSSEYGREMFIGTSLSVGLILGAATIVQMLGGSAGGDTLTALQALPLMVRVSGMIGELIGHGLYAAALWQLAQWCWPLPAKQTARTSL
jgi:type IV secretory pathway VirB2 component (pilin)